MKNITLFIIVLLGSVTLSYSQITQFDFPAVNPLVVSSNDINLTVSDMSLSTGTIETNITIGTYFPNEPYIEEGGGWGSTTQAAAKNFNFTINAAAGYEFSITNISYRGYSTAAGPSAFGFAVGTTNIYAVNAPNGALVQVNQAVSGQTNLTTATIKIQGWRNGSRATSGAGVFRLDDIIITGSVTLICSPSTLTILPTSGPENSIVNVTGTNLSSATATVSGLPAVVTNISATEMEVTIPAGAITSTIDIVDDLGCPASTAFTVIRNAGSCGSLSGLMMTEIYDENTGSRGYIELYNATGATIDLTDYQIDRYGTLITGTISHSYTFPASGTGSSIADGQVLVGMVNSGGTGIEDFAFGGSTSGFNEDDRLELVQISTATVIDDFHDELVGTTGYVYRRNTNVPNPNPNFDATEWTTATQGDISDFGNFTILSNAPIISVQPQSIADCGADISFNVTATPGNSGALTYQWLFNDGIATGWTAVLSTSFTPGIVTGETTDTLSISGIDLQGYQFYCEVTENGSCSTASDAARVTIATSTWTAGAWDNGAPDINTNAIINDNYNTAATFQNAGIIACSLTVNAGSTLTVNDNFTVEVENDLTNNGAISVLTDGSFVQNNDAATFVNSVNDNSSVTKETAFLNAWYEYTYWSSPVVGEQIQDAFFNSNPNRRFWFNAANFKDAGYETNNDNILVFNATSGGVDDVDDNGNDWQHASGTDVLQPGVGYATTLSTIAYIGVTQYAHTFYGPFNTGIITIPVYRNDAETNDFNNNFIGNPYPSAIDFDLFMAENSVALNALGTLDGAVYLWSQDTPPSNTTNGNSGVNFNTSDYAMINDMGQVAGGDNNNDGIITAADEPNRFIPSGQGFFVNYDNTGAVVSTFTNAAESNDLISEGTVTFNNAMRVSGNNDQFFKSSTMPIEDNKLWLLLASDNGVGSQILVGYKDGATNADDGGRFDARRNASTGMAAFLYSTIENSPKNYAIQGKVPSSLTLDEVIPLGIYTTINVATIYTLSISHLQGDFFNNNTIYLKDNLLNQTLNLSNNDYAFTSEVGDFRERFEIVFVNNTLGTDGFETLSNNLSIIELQNNAIKFSYKGDLTITSVKIIDVLGRELYNFKGNKSTEIFNLSNLSNAAYIAQVELSNGTIISKKAIKK